MEVVSISWAGTRTARWSETVDMFERVLGLRRTHEGSGMTAFALPSGDTIEVFTDDEPDHRHFTTGPVVGLAVTDVEAARSEVEAAGLEVFGPVQRGGGMAWVHFRGADGCIWELTGDDR
jgi:predicted enzyme related to lactoylglutathione lyase